MVHGSELVSYNEPVSCSELLVIKEFVAKKTHTDHLSLVHPAGGKHFVS